MQDYKNNREPGNDSEHDVNKTAQKAAIDPTPINSTRQNLVNFGNKVLFMKETYHGQEAPQTRADHPSFA